MPRIRHLDIYFYGFCGRNPHKSSRPPQNNSNCNCAASFSTRHDISPEGLLSLKMSNYLSAQSSDLRPSLSAQPCHLPLIPSALKRICPF